MADKGTKTVTTINLCQSAFNKFIIVTPAVSIDRDCDGAGAIDTMVMEEPNNGLGVSRTCIAVVRDTDENNNSSSRGNATTFSSSSSSAAGSRSSEFTGGGGDSYSWNQWWCSLVYTAIRCFGSGSSTAAGTTTKLLQPCQYRRGWAQERQKRHRTESHPIKCDMNNNGFYSRRTADGTYEL